MHRESTAHSAPVHHVNCTDRFCQKRCLAVNWSMHNCHLPSLILMSYALISVKYKLKRYMLHYFSKAYLVYIDVSVLDIFSLLCHVVMATILWHQSNIRCSILCEFLLNPDLTLKLMKQNYKSHTCSPFVIDFTLGTSLCQQSQQLHCLSCTLCIWTIVTLHIVWD